MVELSKISYNQLRHDDWLYAKDPYGLASFVDENVKKTFLECPNNDMSDKTAILLAVDGDAVVGRSLYYGTTIKIGNSRVKAQSFGSIEVHESQRGKGIGSLIRDFSLDNDEYSFFLCSLLSPACLSILQKRMNDCTIFDFPELVKIVNTEPAFACRGISGVSLKICKSLSNALIRVFDVPIRLRLSRLNKIYTIKKEDTIPQWVCEMCIDDGSEFSEIHDYEWFRWSLTHNFTGKDQDIQSLYSINKGNTPVGFFFIKERLRDDVWDNMVCATLCDWGSVDNDLSEADINILALNNISSHCYYLRTITDNLATLKSLHRLGFINHGTMQMGFRDKNGLHPEMNDIAKWRIRFGCCNSVVVPF